MSAARRVMLELQRWNQSADNTPHPVKLKMKDDNCLTSLIGEITGPPDTPYEGGKFIVEIEVPESYPSTPPKVKFLTKVWHPNISSTSGKICLNILGADWNITLTLRAVLLSVQALLAAPEPADPLAPAVALQQRTQNDVFKKTAQHWTGIYAEGQHISAEYEEKVEVLTALGDDAIFARLILSETNWDMERAVRMQSIRRKDREISRATRESRQTLS